MSLPISIQADAENLNRQELKHASPQHLNRVMRNSWRGFTLIELMFVIVVMGILAGIGIPQLLGVYQRQVLANAANETAQAIKSLQASALANDQAGYSAKPTPLSDCDTTSHAYVDYYQFSIATTTTYQVSRILRSTNATGSTCYKSGQADNYNPSVSISPNHFDSADVGKTITFKTVSGQPSFTTQVQLMLSNDNLVSGTVHYYVCISTSKIYAQNTTCT